jgi:hypothetical protein
VLSTLIVVCKLFYVFSEICTNNVNLVSKKQHSTHTNTKMGCSSLA